MNDMEYQITTEFIELNHLLKLCGLADSGGAGKVIVSEGRVKVDGKKELRMRCKIRPGQVVILGNTRILVTK
jgi:ribosome-associated protein